MTATSPCRACGAPMRWVKTRTGKALPLDPEPVANGTIVLMPITEVAVTIRRGWDDPDPLTPRYVSHFATCPAADQFRTTKTGQPHEPRTEAS